MQSWFVPLDVSHQSVVALYISRVGRSISIRSWNFYKSQNTTPSSNCTFWTCLTPLDCSNRSDWGADLPEANISSSGHQIGHSIYALWSSRRDLRNGVVQLAIWQWYSYLSDRFTRSIWPICPNWANLELCQFWVSTQFNFNFRIFGML